MSVFTQSLVYDITAWKDNKVKICLTQGEGVTSQNPDNQKRMLFRLYDSDGAITIPTGSYHLAIIRPDGSEDLINGTIINGGDAIVGFDVTQSLTDIPGNAKGEIRIITSNSVTKFYGINFLIYAGISDDAATQSPEYNALIAALQSVAALDSSSEIATLDTVIASGGTNPVASGIIYDYLTTYYYTKSAADAKFELLSNKTREISDSARTTTNENYQYPSVAGMKDFVFGNFYTQDQIDEEGFINRHISVFTGSSDKTSSETGASTRVYYEGDVYINLKNGKVWAVTNCAVDDGNWIYSWNYRGTIFDLTAIRPTVIDYTLDVTEWEDGEQELDVSSSYTVTSYTKAEIAFTPTVADTLIDSNVVGLFIENDDGVLTCKTLGKTPLDDITVQITLEETN